MALYSEDFIADSGEALTDKLDANAPISGATKTKVTYDTNGLVTAGADATTADIAASTDRNYVTDAQAVVIANTSGVNTGDQTSVSGNAGTATALQTPRTINGVSFDGTANIQNTLASSNFANQGTTTTVLHGNAAGNPSWGAVTEADQTLVDNTTNDVSTTKHGYVPKAPNDTSKFLRGDGTWAAGGSGAPTDATYITQTANGTLTNEQALSSLSTGVMKVTTTTGVISTATDGTDYLSPSTGEAWTIVTLGSDFTVTNNTLQNVTGFSFSAVSGHFYQVRVTCVDSANNTTGDIAVSLATTGTWVVSQSAYIFYTYYGGTGTRNGPAGGAFATTTLSSASPGTTINNGDGLIRFFGADFMFYADANGTVTFQMGQAAAAVGRTSTIYAGAKFQYRTLY